METRIRILRTLQDTHTHTHTVDNTPKIYYHICIKFSKYTTIVFAPLMDINHIIFLYCVNIKLPVNIGELPYRRLFVFRKLFYSDSYTDVLKYLVGSGH